MLGDRPTYHQEEYAADLVQRLRRAEHAKAERYAVAVLNCVNRREMSGLIDRMQVALEEP